MQGGDEEREGGFEIDAVGRKDDIGLGRNMARKRLAPIQDRRFHLSAKIVKGDIIFHQLEHGQLVCDVDGHASFTPPSNRQSDKTTSSSQLHATQSISSQIQVFT